MASFSETPVSLLVHIASERTGVHDESAWTRLFELYAPAIRAFAAEHGGEGEEEDVAQEIFMRLVDVLRGDRVKVGGGAVRFRRYLATLIRNELVSRWRRRCARGEGRNVSIDDSAFGVEVPVDSNVAATIDAKWRLARRAASALEPCGLRLSILASSSARRACRPPASSPSSLPFAFWRCTWRGPGTLCPAKACIPPPRTGARTPDPLLK